MGFVVVETTDPISSYIMLYFGLRSNAKPKLKALKISNYNPAYSISRIHNISRYCSCSVKENEDCITSNTVS